MTEQDKKDLAWWALMVVLGLLIMAIIKWGGIGERFEKRRPVLRSSAFSVFSINKLANEKEPF